jgi:hypothetical protein
MDASPSNLFYESIIHSYTKKNLRFLHRKRLADEIQEAIQQDLCQFVLITETPLTGKSTIMAQLALDNPDWLRYFIRRDQRSPRVIQDTLFLLQAGFSWLPTSRALQAGSNSRLCRDRRETCEAKWLGNLSKD